LNIGAISLVTAIMFGILQYLSHRDFDKYYKEKATEVQESKDILRYIHNMERRSIIMWFFIMINIRIIIANIAK